MTTPKVPLLTPTSDDVREAERVDEAKTADDAPAPVHSPDERKLLVRDAHGNDPYGDDQYGPSGTREEPVLGKSPYELPDPTAADVRRAKDNAGKA